MKRYQTGEVMVVVMVVMLAVVLFSREHMGMMGMMHGDDHADKSEKTAPQTKAEPAQTTASKESPEHQH